MSGTHDYPDVVLFKPRYPVARKAHTCEMCGEPIAIGEKYQRLACVEDGRFVSTVEHFRADADPSGCPKIARRQKAELAAQFERDRAQFFPDDQQAARRQALLAKEVQYDSPGN